jgi:endo-1,4-beta-xylanase
MMKTFRRVAIQILAVFLLLLSGNIGTAQTQPLRVSADQRSFLIGTAVAMTPFGNEAIYYQTLRREFNIIVAENAFKWDAVRPSRTTFNFTDTDALVNFAEANHMKIRGHTLVWHNQLPSWLTNGNFTRDEVIEILRQHILTFVGRYKGRIWAWDVVNEAIDDTTAGFRTTSFWYQKIGQEYIKLAFEFAHEADPDARLYYNDYSIEGLGNKSNAVFNLVSDLKNQSVPVDGVGWQMHQINGFRIQEQHRINARRIADLGLELSLTEMDVRIPLPTTAEKLQQQALAYKDSIEFCMTEPNCKALVMWGFTDKYSWIPSTFNGQGDALIFDASYQPKPAHVALREVLEVGADLTPKISAASRSGKQLIINGEKFLEGAQIFINSEKQKKVFVDEENPSTMIVARKAGKFVKPGDLLQVRNPDGRVSNEYIYQSAGN